MENTTFVNMATETVEVTSLVFDDWTTEQTEEPPPPTPGDNVMIIMACTVVIVALITLVIIIYLLRRNNKVCWDVEDETPMVKDDSIDPCGSGQEALTASHHSRRHKLRRLLTRKQSKPNQYVNRDKHVTELNGYVNGVLDAPLPLDNDDYYSEAVQHKISIADQAVKAPPRRQSVDSQYSHDGDGTAGAQGGPEVEESGEYISLKRQKVPLTNVTDKCDTIAAGKPPPVPTGDRTKSHNRNEPAAPVMKPKPATRTKVKQCGAGVVAGSMPEESPAIEEEYYMDMEKGAATLKREQVDRQMKVAGNTAGNPDDHPTQDDLYYMDMDNPASNKPAVHTQATTANIAENQFAPERAQEWGAGQSTEELYYNEPAMEDEFENMEPLYENQQSLAAAGLNQSDQVYEEYEIGK